jgi:GNAT superfamily N-acetyltransferase
MATVLQLCRQLHSKPQAQSLPGTVVRHYAGDADMAAWLDLRHQAFARKRIGVRQWSADDFHAEFTSRWWWKPESMWLAVSTDANVLTPLASSSQQIIGAITLAMRGEADQSAQARPVVHWLVVHPRWRRRGIGRLLLSQLESAAWDAGHRELWLETHVAWEAAVKFYQSQGYDELNSQQSRRTEI